MSIKVFPSPDLALRPLHRCGIRIAGVFTSTLSDMERRIVEPLTVNQTAAPTRIALLLELVGVRIAVGAVLQ